MMTRTIHIDGDLGDLNATIEDGIDALAGAIYEEMEDIKAASQEVVPFRFGVLKASADVVGVNMERFGPESGMVVIGYGGAASAYSVMQHENAEFRHAEGKTWKYLEGPMLQAMAGVETRLAGRIRARMAT